MYNMIVQGTTSKSLIAYVERVYNHLGLDEFEDCFFDLEFSPKCSGGAGGYCHGDDEEVSIELARRDNVGRIPKKDLMINIAHEMVHAQQIASGRLIDKGFAFATSPKGVNVMTTKQIFDGQEYVGVNYNDQPWEIEAYAREKAIYEICK